MRRRLILLGATVVVMVAVVEASLLGLDRFAPPPAAPTPHHPWLYQADRALGYTLRPSSTLTYRFPTPSSREITLISNRDGFRNAREFDEPDVRPRLWVLGDSMTLGEGVPAEHRLTEVIGRLEPGWRVDNMGMTGWGVDLMVRAFEQISRRVRPDAVLLAFYTDDFRRLGARYAGVGFALPRMALEAGALVDRPAPAPLPFWRRLRIVQAVEQTHWRLTRNQWAVNEALLDRLRGNKAGVPLAVAFLPGRGDTDEDRQRRAFLREWSARTATPFVDLTSALQAPGLGEVHLPGDPHWNERGHEIAGTALHGFLREARLPK